MNITKEEVRHVAQLARLSLSDAELERMTSQLDAILQYVAQLEELDTSEVLPTTHPHRMVNAFRDDVARPSLSREQALANAPEKNSEAFVVPRIIR